MRDKAREKRGSSDYQKRSICTFPIGSEEEAAERVAFPFRLSALFFFLEAPFRTGLTSSGIVNFSGEGASSIASLNRMDASRSTRVSIWQCAPSSILILSPLR